LHFYNFANQVQIYSKNYMSIGISHKHFALILAIIISFYPSVFILNANNTFTIVTIHNNSKNDDIFVRTEIIKPIDTIKRQSLIKKFKKLNPKRPVILWSLMHPFHINKVADISILSIKITDSLEKAGVLTNPLGGQLDAFRHGVWMAMLTQEIGAKNAYKLGIANEKANYINFKKNKPYSSYHNSLMDSLNNLKGIEIGKLLITGNHLYNAIIDSICNDNFYIICPTENYPIDDNLGNTENINPRIWRRNEQLISSGWRGIIWEP
jgi:hypothetical protein